MKKVSNAVFRPFLVSGFKCSILIEFSQYYAVLQTLVVVFQLEVSGRDPCVHVLLGTSRFTHTHLTLQLIPVWDFVIYSPTFRLIILCSCLSLKWSLKRARKKHSDKIWRAKINIKYFFQFRDASVQQRRVASALTGRMTSLCRQ